jgi:hypothetical protein
MQGFASVGEKGVGFGWLRRTPLPAPRFYRGVVFNVPDMTAPSPLSTGLRLHYELKSLANLTNQRIDFDLSGLFGKTYRLSDYKGKIICFSTEA